MSKSNRKLRRTILATVPLYIEYRDQLMYRIATARSVNVDNKNL